MKPDYTMEQNLRFNVALWGTTVDGRRNLIWIGLDTLFENKTDSKPYSEMKDTNFLD